MKHLLDKELNIWGDIFKIIGVGVVRDDGTVYLHLASTTRFRQQRNGKCPIQFADFVSIDVANTAR